ncbi:hypothetical protein [Flavobacterium nitratireducens]|uniref:hypothetical protein n=1 Tax=Flavobacterium nitratireducens TaxID=992289 RepID=UPI0024154738|nr:hypothetical protein [Flavobacterium nitratireducens]
MIGIYELIPNVGVDTFALLFGMLLLVLVNRKFQFDRMLFLYFAILVVLNILSYGLSTANKSNIFINNSIQVLVFALFLSFYKKNYIYDSEIEKIINYFGLFAVLGVFIQYVSYYFFDKPLPLRLPIANFVKDGFDIETFGGSILYGRPTSFFKEPSHFAIYIVPIMYRNLERKNYWMFGLFTLGLILSTSTLGIVLLGIMLIRHSVSSAKSIGYVLLSIIPLVLFMMLYSDKFEAINEDYSNKLDTSSLNDNIRVFGVLKTFDYFEFKDFLFGIGHNQLGDFQLQHNFAEAYNYANSFFMAVFSFGVIGFFVFLLILKKGFNNKFTTGYFLIFVAVLFSDQILFNHNFFYLYMISFVFLNVESSKNPKLSPVQKKKMKVIFYYDERSLNDATIYYVGLIEKVFLSMGIDMEYRTKLGNVEGKDIIFTITEKYFCMAKFRYPFLKTIYWAQGVAPEEYFLSGRNNKIVYLLKCLIEFISIRYSTLLFVVSNRMLRHYRNKYFYNKQNYLVMPCYNLKYLSGLASSTGERYKYPSFVYAGSMATWQCVEETLQIFKAIQQEIPLASLTLLVKEQDEAFDMVSKYGINNVEIKYVNLSDLQKELMRYKYGFIIREDILVNNVSTPTKMNSYLASAIIPIYTDSVHAFVENIDLGEYSICLNSKSSVYKKAQQIIDFEKRVINSIQLDEKIQSVFKTYYNDEMYLKQIELKFDNLIKGL